MNKLLKIIEVIPYKTFKQKIKITKSLTGNYIIEDLGNLLYIERWEVEK